MDVSRSVKRKCASFIICEQNSDCSGDEVCLLRGLTSYPPLDENKISQCGEKSREYGVCDEDYDCEYDSNVCFTQENRCRRFSHLTLTCQDDTNNVRSQGVATVISVTRMYV